MKKFGTHLELVIEHLMTERPCSVCGATTRSGSEKPVCGECFDKDLTRRWVSARDLVIRRAREAMPTRYRDADFGPNRPQLVARCVSLEAIALAEAAVESALGGAIVGRAGSGKSTLAAAMLIGHLQRILGTPDLADDNPGLGWVWTQASRCGYVLADDLPRARPQHGLGRGEAPLVAFALIAPVLVIDDIGLERMDDTMREIVAKRADNALATIYTTTLTAAEMTAKYGDGVARRIYGGAPTIQLGGP